MREEENSNDIGNAMQPGRPTPIHSDLLKLWSVFLKLSGRMKSREINQKGSDEDLDAGLHSDHSGRVAVLMGTGKSYT